MSQPITTTETVGDYARMDVLSDRSPVDIIEQRFTDAWKVEAIPARKLSDPDLWATVPFWMQAWAVDHPVEDGWARDAFDSWLDAYLPEAPRPRPGQPADDRPRHMVVSAVPLYLVVDTQRPGKTGEATVVVCSSTTYENARQVAAALDSTPIAAR